jgi:proline dehydrogenase
MEDNTATDATLRIYKAVHAKYPRCGTVLQAYMRRTLSDIDGLPGHDAHIRLCKGIYIEPRTIAWKEFHTVRANYTAALRKLLKRGVYTGIATHDEHLVWAGMAAVDELGLSKDEYEFQMLLGVDAQLRKIIIGHGHKLRVYVPYGKHWYAYSTRRLRENPDMANYVIKAFFGIKPKQ